MVTTTLCTSGMVLAKAGVGVSSALTAPSAGVILSGDFIVDLWIVEAESFINNVTRYDFVTAYSGLSANKKKTLQEIASSFAAVYAIQYDLSGFSSRVAAEDKMTFLNDSVLRGIELLKEDKTQSFIGSD